MFKEHIGSHAEAISTLAANPFTVTSASVGADTLTTDEFINGVYIQTGTPGAATKTTPSAAEIVAAIGEMAVGSVFEFVIDNGGDGTLTLGAGDGVTLSGTATVLAAKNRRFMCVVTDVETPAVRVICLAALA